ncbi:NUDIX domain-containing protein [Ottowia sp.]|uniref:NUDIX hydrolase n=1 Tax=Ottowia sp. TaxID=1898956 RepID=UPI0025F52B00|nr:NUDIX domain-containing protein [Ottowia sp.]MBK6616420.1 NUDIX hydrolase [Ottowia sp.]
MAVILTVDVVLMTILEGALHVALFKRANDPFKEAWALPGGYIHEDTDSCAADAALRVLVSKTGIASPYLEELRTWSGPFRDPRGWSMTDVYYALLPASELTPAQAPGIRLVPAGDRVLRGLPFDHAEIVEAAIERVRSKSSYSSLPAFLCGDTFSIRELHAAYEAVRGEPINMSGFRRKIEEMGILEPAKGTTAALGARTKGAPAQLYRLAKAFRRSLAVRARGISDTI